jgi:small subunit ribosomal protein S5
MRKNYQRRDRRDDAPQFNIDQWEPRTELGKRVKARQVTSIEQIFNEGRHITEAGIIDALLPNIKNEIVEIASVQRMTKNNRKAKYRATAIVGDGNGHVGVGAAKDVEVKAAVDSAIEVAKFNIIPIMLGCGSSQCSCGTKHSLPLIMRGKCGSVEVILKPAPRGLGVVANKPVRKMLEMAGVRDLWSFSRGRTRVKYNSLMATYRALQNINSIKNISAIAVNYASK